MFRRAKCLVRLLHNAGGADHRVISGNIHVLKTGCRRCDCTRPHTVRTRRSIIASRAGPNAASGRIHSAMKHERIHAGARSTSFLRIGIAKSSPSRSRPARPSGRKHSRQCASSTACLGTNSPSVSYSTTAANGFSLAIIYGRRQFVRYGRSRAPRLMGRGSWRAETPRSDACVGRARSALL